MTPAAPTFGALLRHMRLAAGLTQEGLAERASLSAKAVSELERDPARAPRLETVTLLADALGQDQGGRARLLAAARPVTPPPARGVTVEEPRRRLPRPLTPLIGRARDADAVDGLVRRGAAQLVTLAGPGGVGKTRLAIHAGERLATSFADGVVFVDLAPLRDPGLVLATAARALGITATGDRSPEATLHDYLRPKCLLLVLDNFEHVLAASQALLHLLEGCVHLKALVTSREPLRVRGERVYHVPSLALPEDLPSPSPRVAPRSPAVDLFLERAAAGGADLAPDAATAATVVEICRRLDGLPLAIELAAARVRLFPPQALLRRLAGHRLGDQTGPSLEVLSDAARDAPGRHQTLRNAIDWSYRLLSTGEQHLFAQLSVFAGGWTLEAAEAVCTAQGNVNTVEGTASLIDKNLVRQEEMLDGEPRFSMLETIREFARERLDSEPEEAQTVRRRHAEHCLALAREADAKFWGPEHALWLGRLTRELDNLRAALAWSRDSGEVELTLELGSAPLWFWHDSGHWREALTWLESALALAPPPLRTRSRAAALNTAGLCNWCLGNVERARAQAEESLAICRELGYHGGVGRALHGLGVIAGGQGDVASARDLIEAGLSLTRAAGDQPFVGLGLHNLGIFAAQAEDEPAARSWIEDSRNVWRDLGSVEGLSLTANSLGALARASGQYAEAAAHFRESLELIGDAGPRGWRASTLVNLGRATHRLGDEREAAALFTEALLLSRELGDRRGMADAVASLACLGASSPPAQTVRLLGAASAAAEAARIQLDRSWQTEYGQDLAIARGRVGDDAYDEAWRQGRSLSLEQAVTETLELFKEFTR